MEHDKEPGQWERGPACSHQGLPNWPVPFQVGEMLLPEASACWPTRSRSATSLRGMGLGEGLAFYMVCASLWIIYTIYVFMAGAMGAVASAPCQTGAAPPARGRRRAHEHASSDLPY